MEDLKKQNNDPVDTYRNSLACVIGTIIGDKLKELTVGDNKESHNEEETSEEGNNCCNSECKSSDVDKETEKEYYAARYSVFQCCYSSNTEARKVWHDCAQSALRKLGKALGLED